MYIHRQKSRKLCERKCFFLDSFANRPIHGAQPAREGTQMTTIRVLTAILAAVLSLFAIAPAMAEDLQKIATDACHQWYYKTLPFKLASHGYTTAANDLLGNEGVLEMKVSEIRQGRRIPVEGEEWETLLLTCDAHGWAGGTEFGSDPIVLYVLYRVRDDGFNKIRLNEKFGLLKT